MTVFCVVPVVLHASADDVLPVGAVVPVGHVQQRRLLLLADEVFDQHQARDHHVCGGRGAFGVRGTRLHNQGHEADVASTSAYKTRRRATIAAYIQVLGQSF